MGATLSAGMALRWLRDSVLGWGGSDAYERMNAAAAASPPGSGGLLFLPYLVGERPPHMDPTARGTFWGKSRSRASKRSSSAKASAALPAKPQST